MLGRADQAPARCCAPSNAWGSAPEFLSARRLNAASSISWPEVVVSRWSIWLRIVTQDITPIQAQMVPVLTKAPCDVLAVAGSWDDLPVQGTFVSGMSSRSQVCGMSFVFRIKFVWDVSGVSRLRDALPCYGGAGTSSETRSQR